MIGELFESNAKTAARTAAALCNWTLAFLVTKYYRGMVRLMGESSTFATFGMLSLMGTIFVSVLVPETKSGNANGMAQAAELHEMRNEPEGIADRDANGTEE